MFATYPPEATLENWLSTCLNSAILSRLEQLDAGQAPTEFPNDVDAEYRETVSRFTGIVQRFNNLAEALSGLDVAGRAVVRRAVETQNNIPDVFDPATECYACDQALPEIHGLARSLFEFSFSRLSRIKSPGMASTIRDVHYEISYNHLAKKACPFCGLERLEPHHPDIPRPDLDHYLPISRYPFSGVNLKNLTPMGDRCNSSYKLAADILYDDDGTRLPCFDPYGDVTTDFSLAGSRILGTLTGAPDWTLQLAPASLQTDNWDRIFRIKVRLEQSLNAEFSLWAAEIAGFLRNLDYDANVLEEALEGLERYRQICSTEALPGIGRLKSEVASLLIRDLESDEMRERSHTFLIELWSAA